MISHRLLATGYLVFSVAVIMWDILIAGRIAQLQRTPRGFQAVTAFAGLLLAPAILIAISGASILYGRAIQTVSWLWPLTAILFTFQALYAVGRRLVSPLVGFPLLAYNAVIAIVAVAKYSISRGTIPPQFALALTAAQAAMLRTFFSSPALWSPLFLQIPMFSPSLPARFRFSKLFRAVLAVSAIAMAALVFIELPGGLAAIRSYRGHTKDQLQEHPEGDFRIGLKVFPNLRSGPPPLALQKDLELADTLGVDAISIVIDPEAAKGVALDSIAHSVDRTRNDSTLLIVALGYPKNADAKFRQSSSAYTDERIRDVNRIVRRLKPDYLLPAVEPYSEGSRLIGSQPPEYWIRYFTRAANLAHFIYPRTKVAVGASTYGVRDSVLYTWAAGPSSKIDVVGFSLLAGFDGLTSTDSYKRIAQRWMKQYEAHPKEHWVFAAGGYPMVHGEQNQQLALWDVLAWATTQPAIKGLIIYEAGDYDASRGLRAPGGRLRSSVAAVLRAERGLAESGQK
ncbi:MAG: hypothetical protein H0W63_04780 [Gemmatimonadaceae bacterium]|nr:hypothetical protein [Gemmatimonadaceae bacterium]